MVAVVALVLTVTVTGFMTVVFGTMYTETDGRLRDAGQVVAARYPFPAEGSAGGAQAPGPAFTDLAIDVVDVHGHLERVLQRPTRTIRGMPSAADAARAVQARAPVTVAGPGGPWRLLATRLPDGAWLLVGQPVARLTGLHDHLLLVSTVAATAILLVTVSLTTHLVGYGLRPLTRIARTTSRIEAGDLSRRLPVDGRDEVGQVAGALNSMLDRIESSFARQQAAEDRLRRFVHDAGHELRTPVTAIRGWADLYRSGGVPPRDLPTAMRRIADEARRIGLLVDDLLLLASLDQPAGTRPGALGASTSGGRGADGREPDGSTPADGGPPRRPVDLAEVVRDAVLDAQVVEPDRPLETHLPGPGVALVRGDPAGLHQVVANLLGNIRAHTPPGTAARVHLQRVSAHGSDRIVLRICDDGPGVPAQARARVFDRFFRADPGRRHRRAGTDGTGTDGTGTGLGLSIVAAIVSGHGGDIRVEPATTGFVVRISLPALPEQPPLPDDEAGPDASPCPG